MGEYRSACNDEDVELHLPLYNGAGMRRMGKHPNQLTHPEMRAAMKKPSSGDAVDEHLRIKLKQTRGQMYDRVGAYGHVSQDMALEEAALLCHIVAAKEAERLPHDSDKLRLTQIKRPTNRTASLLRSGKSVEDVAKDAALRVVQRWVELLRPHIAEDLMARTISDMVHHCEPPPDFLPSLSQTRRPPTSVGVSRTGAGYLLLRPSPTPPADSLLGKGLRKVVPRTAYDDEPWEFLEDVLSALALEDGFIQNAPSHIRRPNTSARAALASRQKYEEAFAHEMAPEFEKLKSVADAGQNGAPDRKTALGVCAKLRLSGSNGGWATYKQDDRCRVTCWCFSPQVIQKQPTFGEVPGPGSYHRMKSTSTLDTIRTGKFPSVGSMRAVASEVLLSQRERFQ
mmetsp:Transcript_80069/g.126467  ORF Transcript_80069/g.126467 Transcript_80069/m.126467 type:complete len:397 (-) Transcript_80069:146-1336(-)